jgi:hypothetical protein
VVARDTRVTGELELRPPSRHPPLAESSTEPREPPFHGMCTMGHFPEGSQPRSV